MIDISIIKEKYSNMSSEQLINLAHKEGKDLSTEALSVLYETFLERGLDTEVFPVLRVHKLEEKRKKDAAMQASKELEISKVIWTYCFDAKEKGVSDQDIFKGLESFIPGIEIRYWIVKNMETHAEKLLKEYKKSLQVSGLLTLGGIILLAIATSGSFELSHFFLGGAAVFTGGLRFIIILKNKFKFEEILKNISAQKKDGVAGKVIPVKSD